MTICSKHDWWQRAIFWQETNLHEERVHAAKVYIRKGCYGGDS